MEHTKGKWIVNKGTDGAVIFELDIGTIAQIPIDLEAWEANAQLIASAPKMAQLLTLYLADCQLEKLEYNDDTYNLALEIGRELEMPEALAKAEGK